MPSLWWRSFNQLSRFSCLHLWIPNLRIDSRHWCHRRYCRQQYASQGCLGTCVFRTSTCELFIRSLCVWPRNLTCDVMVSIRKTTPNFLSRFHPKHSLCNWWKPTSVLHGPMLSNSGRTNVPSTKSHPSFSYFASNSEFEY